MSSRTGVAALALTCLAQAGLADDGTVVVNSSAAYPEGPVVVGDEVYYAEMGADRVLRWDESGNTDIWSRRGCLPTSVAVWGEADLIVLCHREGAVFRISRSGETLGALDRDSSGNRFVNPNASINDSRGGVYFSASGDFSPDAPATGAILYLDRDGRLARVAEGIRYANGVALSPDGTTLFVSEHLARRVLAYAVSEDGLLSGRQVFLGLDDVVGADPQRSWEVGPDGLTVDRRGNLYIAEYGGGRVIVVDPAGGLLATIDIDERYVTAPALIDDDRRIFVTAPVSLYDPTAPGKVYVVENPVYRDD